MRTMDELFQDFTISDANKPEDSSPITLWLPNDIKARYDRLQEMSGRRFSKKLKEVLVEVIGHAEKLAG